MLDRKDSLIINELIKNSRITLSSIAKKSRMSKEVVLYRLNKLKEKLDLNFITEIDIEKLGFKHYSCLLEIKFTNLNDEQRFIQLILNHKYIGNLSRNVGKWNLIFDIYAKNENQLDKIYNEIIQKFKDRIINKNLIKEISIFEYYSNKIIKSQNLVLNNKINPSKNKISIDNIDKLILKELSKNSRIDLVQLSIKIRLTPNAVKYRIKQLKKNNIILNYSLNINFFKLGYQLYNLQLKIKNESESELLSFVKNSPEALYFYKYEDKNLPWNIDIGIIMKDIFELREFIFNLNEICPEPIINLHIMSEILKVEAPKGVFE